MASLLPAASAAASATRTSSSSSPSSILSFINQQRYRCCQFSNVVSFRLSSNSKHKLRFSTKGLRSNWSHSSLVKAQLKEVAPIDGSSNAAVTPATKSEVPTLEEKDGKPVNELSPADLASEASISEFMTQVASLVKLVDSKDIVELQLKQLDCEVIIRKKEAMPQPPSHAPVVMMQSHSPSAFPPAPPAPTPSAPVPSATPASSSSPPAAKSAKSSIPPLKCPMAGTFYRCSGPGEPPFVKVGDRVQKGQVLCIIEAMKLMNEIEADQSGTVVEILVDDGKSVSVDMPLFAIEP